MNFEAKKAFTQRARAALSFAGSQFRHLITQHPDLFPLYTVKGKWKHDSEAWTNWCEGFLGGVLWIIYRHTKDTWWLERAEHYSQLIEHRKTDRNVHDLGFLFLPTWKVWYELTGDSAKNQVVIDAGKTLALRFQPKGRYLCSFVSQDSIFIDIMMNVGIIFYAAQQTKDASLLQLAVDHCLTTRRFLVRGDASTSHEGLFDLETGEFLKQTTHQGWRNDSSWARGQTWAIYGFTTAYQFTQDARFLDTAQRCADFYIERTPRMAFLLTIGKNQIPLSPTKVPLLPWPRQDYSNFPKPLPNPQRPTVIEQYAFLILDTLLSPEFLANETPGWEGILRHGIYHERKKLGVDESVMWGEYFFLSALDKALRLAD